MMKYTRTVATGKTAVRFFATYGFDENYTLEALAVDNQPKSSDIINVGVN